MNNRNLSRRLERLEESMIPVTVRKVWQIITVNSDGTKEPTGITIEWPSRPAPDREQGTSLRIFDK
jgi:hypothetical protein